MAHTAGAYPGFGSFRRLGIFLLPPEWDASPLQGNPPALCRWHPFIHLERGTMRVKCLAQEHNTVTSARSRTGTA